MIVLYGTPEVAPPEPEMSALIDVDVTFNGVADSAPIGSEVGVQFYAEHEGYIVTYALTDSASGRFSVGGLTGVVLTASEVTEGAYPITCLATSSEGSTKTLTTTIYVISPGYLLLETGDLLLMETGDQFPLE